ncbi:acetyl-CoA carboxylase biotin carboxyl carrier protein [Salirhabdus sp. Marseille-P4669]|uniref:acetyl-CoA carboxylase biotin carboxyl carrier protein n=1 Tax=Salirhabdus sp. Marseille-P4669 TaxID=2042310 RepID=UPI000C7A4AA6|nr:acetyl-CoA carboxylase biotin carboxyl carrier protein [Salirhabdus sp. Marseille-P4669]
MLKIQEIRELIKLIDESSIDEFKYEVDGAKVKMKKNNDKSGPTTTIVEQPVAAVQQPVVQATPQVEVPKEESNVVEQKEEKKDTKSKEFDYEITSPMVGTFYRSPSPDSDPFIEVGDKVKADTTVCIVEAMKLFNEIEAEVTGEIVEILVNNGELVEYGQPLFRVKK